MEADETVGAWLDDAFAERWERFAAEADADAEPRDRDVPDPSGPDRTAREPLDLAVVERDLPGHLFGFTRRDSDHVTVNRALYRVDRESTIRHERMHHRSPKDELTIRYLNGDLDVENTLSFQANRAGRVGSGSGRIPPRAAARTSYGSPGTAYDR